MDKEGSQVLYGDEEELEKPILINILSKPAIGSVVLRINLYLFYSGKTFAQLRTLKQIYYRSSGAFLVYYLEDWLGTIFTYIFTSMID